VSDRADEPQAGEPEDGSGHASDPSADSETVAARTDSTGSGADAGQARIDAAVEPPSPDVALAEEASPLPGAHRGGFSRLPTAPVSVTIESAPAEPGTGEGEEPVMQWLMPEPPAPRRGLAAWALAFSIGGLVVSLFVGWGFPIGLVGVVTAILALRRPLESRTVAVWALVLGSVSVLYSAGWLVFAASRANLFG
jgi:hypothetical protein